MDAQKCSKVELGGLAKDWHNVYAESVAMSSTSSVDYSGMVPMSVKTESGGKKTSSKEPGKVFS